MAYKIRKRVFSGITLSDVNIPEVSIGGSQHYNTVHNYYI